MMLARKPTYQIGDVVVDEVAGHRGRITRLKKLGTVYWYWLAAAARQWWREAAKSSTTGNPASTRRATAARSPESPAPLPIIQPSVKIH